MAIAITFIWFSLAIAAPQDAIFKALPNAHAHNDYLHKRPLLDALDHGFCSVEVDIFLVGDQLLVGHDRWSLKKDRTLQKLYLAPLMRRIEKNDGRIYKDGPVFTLLIDIKQNGDTVYAHLKNVLEGYRPMLSGLDEGEFKKRAVQIVISGSCPRDLIRNDSNRLVGIDGRLHDLESDEPANLIPMISARWGSTFKWRGHSELSSVELQKLESIVARAHKSGRIMRFWATPESTTVWDRLLATKVDLINTDRLPMLRDYLINPNRVEHGNPK